MKNRYLIIALLGLASALFIPRTPSEITIDSTAKPYTYIVGLVHKELKDHTPAQILYYKFQAYLLVNDHAVEISMQELNKLQRMFPNISYAPFKDQIKANFFLFIRVVLLALSLIGVLLFYTNTPAASKSPKTSWDFPEN